MIFPDGGPGLQEVMGFGGSVEREDCAEGDLHPTGGDLAEESGEGRDRGLRPQAEPQPDVERVQRLVEGRCVEEPGDEAGVQAEWVAAGDPVDDDAAERGENVHDGIEGGVTADLEDEVDDVVGAHGKCRVAPVGVLAAPMTVAPRVLAI